MSAIWVLSSVYCPSDKPWNRRLIEDIDWVGAIIFSTALGILLYVLATTTISSQRFSKVKNIVLFLISIVPLALFPLYMAYQVRHHKPALIPNNLWRNASFTTTCIVVFSIGHHSTPSTILRPCSKLPLSSFEDTPLHPYGVSQIRGFKFLTKTIQFPTRTIQLRTSKFNPFFASCHDGRVH